MRWIPCGGSRVWRIKQQEWDDQRGDEDEDDPEVRRGIIQRCDVEYGFMGENSAGKEMQRWKIEETKSESLSDQRLEAEEVQSWMKTEGNSESGFCEAGKCGVSAESGAVIMIML